jgi:hypothetical protein
MSNPSNLRRTFYQVLWGDSGPFDFGLLDTVDPALDLKLEPITSGTTGKLILGQRVVGVEGYVSIQVRETTLTMLQKVTPWWSSGAIPLVPAAANVDLYTYAQLLTLHPGDQGVVTTQDLKLTKAVPAQAFKLRRDNKSDDVYELRFTFFPDRAQLPNVVYGTIG